MVIAKPGLDGHDRGAKIIARALRDAGMEVIYTGLHQTPEQIVETAIQEDADAVGISILSGAHMTLVPRIVGGLRANGADDVLVVVGGTIPPDDADELTSGGVAAVFTPGAPTSEIVDFLRRPRGRVGRTPDRRARRRSAHPGRIRSTESAPGAPARDRRVLRLRRAREGDDLVAFRELSGASSARGSASTERLVDHRLTGTASSSERAGIVTHAPPGQTRAARDGELEIAAPGRDAHVPFSPSVTGFAALAGTGKRSRRRLVQVREAG